MLVIFVIPGLRVLQYVFVSEVAGHPPHHVRRHERPVKGQEVSPVVAMDEYSLSLSKKV